LHFLPCLEYFCAFLRHDEIFLEGQESYIKGSYRNKTNIVTSSGVQLLSIPLSRGKHQQKNIQEVEISYQEDWQRQHWRSILTAYQNAPFFEDYEGEISALLSNKTPNLWDYNLGILKGILEILQMDTPLGVTETYEKNPQFMLDLRQQILPKNTDWTLTGIRTTRYTQVFEDRQPFVHNASILDLIFCKGPESILILEKMNDLMTSV